MAVMDESAIEPIARAMVDISASIREGDTALVFYDPGGALLARRVARLSSEKGARVLYIQRDQALEAEIAATCSERNALRSSVLNDFAVQMADAVFMIRCASDSEAFASVPRDRMVLWNRAREPYLMNYRVNHTRWILIYWPTEAEATAEGLSHAEYVDLFLHACHQPWSDIATAQDHLIGILDAGRLLEIAANPDDPDPRKRTQVSMDIGPMTFVNSIIDRNFPGSEVFSSPVRESVTGQIYASGTYAYDGRTMRDIFLRIQSGKIVEADARTGASDLVAILDTDEGARYFGEIALGTNPGLRRKVMNGLLNEKVGGSFHITPGRAYSFLEYEGQPVRVDNGNRSQIHWDIAIPMLPAYGGGSVRVDGVLVQSNGRFVDPALGVLNVGLD